MESLRRPMKLNVKQVNILISRIQYILNDLVRQIKHIFDESNTELNYAKERYILQINQILKKYEIKHTFQRNTKLTIINTFLYKFKKNKQIKTDIDNATYELDKYFQIYRQNEYLWNYYKVNYIFDYIKTNYNNVNYSKHQIYNLADKLSNIIESHKINIEPNYHGQTCAELNFSQEGIILVNTFDFTVLELIHYLLENVI